MSKKKRIVYIIGPIFDSEGLILHGQDRMRYTNMQRMLEEAGYTAFNPSCFEGFPFDVAFDLANKVLDRCNYVITLRESVIYPYATDQLDRAAIIGIPILSRMNVSK